MGTPATCCSQLCVCRLVAHANNGQLHACYIICYIYNSRGDRRAGLVYTMQAKHMHTCVHIPYITVGLHGYRYNITIILYIIFDVSTNKYNYITSA